MLLEPGEHRPVGVRHIDEPDPSRSKCPRGRIEVLALPEKLAEAVELRDRDPVTGPNRIVRKRLAAGHEGFMDVGGEQKPPCSRSSKR